MTISKTEQMLEYLRSGNIKQALRLTKSFRLGFSPAQKKVLDLGYECLVSPYIYRQLGKDTDACVRQAVSLLHSIYADRI
jgi:hypothetical protein